MVAILLPNGEQTFLDPDGNPLAGGSVGMYIPTTLTPKDTWQDSAHTILNTNPILLDAAGRAIIYGIGIYRQIVKDVFGQLQWDQLTFGDGTSGGGGTDTTSVQTISALRALDTSGLVEDQAFNVLGYYAPGDGGGGLFYLTTTSPGQDNGGTIVYSSTSGFYYIRPVSGDEYAMDWFGAFPDGTTDYTTIMNNAWAFVYAQGGALRCSTGMYRASELALAVSGLGTFNLLGSGTGNTVIKKAGTTPNIPLMAVTGAALVNCRNSSIENLTLDANSVSGCDALVLTNVGSFQTRGLLTQNCQYGLNGQSMIKCQHFNGEFNSGTIGVVIRKATGGVQPNFNIFYDCIAQSNQGPAWDIDDGEGIKLINCDIENNGLDGTSPQVLTRQNITAGIGAGTFSMTGCHLERGQGGYDIDITAPVSGELDIGIYDTEIIGSHANQSIRIGAVRSATLVNVFVPSAGDTVAAGCESFICIGGEISVLAESFTDCAILGLHTSAINCYNKLIASSGLIVSGGPINAAANPITALNAPFAIAGFDGTASGTNPPGYGHNVTSVTRNSAGNYTVNYTTGLSVGNFAQITALAASGQTLATTKVGSGATTYQFICTDLSGAATDAANILFAAYGR